MGFKSVYRLLQEIFPQVDVRILKAVAIENPKDADAAVEDVLNVVLPSTSSVDVSLSSTKHQVDKHHCNSTDYQDNKDVSIGVEQSFSLKHQGPAEETQAWSHSKPGSVVSEDANEIPEKRSSAGNEEINVFAGSDQGSHSVSSSMMHEHTDFSGGRSDIPHTASKDFVEQVGSYLSALSDGLQSCSDETSEAQNMQATFLPEQSAIHEEVTHFADCALKNDFSSIGAYEKLESSGSLKSSSEQVVDIQDDSFSTTIVTQSGQICRIDHLEDAIEDAKSNKKTLFSAMETVINMMKEVEVQEKEAEHAKEEAPRGGLATLNKVEDLRQMLQRAREVNDMHAGEIYGEKSILATEVRELQSRLINLSDERDKSLSILDEMKRTLEVRLAAAEATRVAAEKEKQEKEESARKALAEQEAIMEKVVQESKRLQQEAEENSKLRDFLMDRGRVVDILQGEIAVICLDVKLLKENFDECVPFSKSVSSSQTSCILASSSSFYKGLIADWVPEKDQISETPTKITPASSVHDEDHLQTNNTSPKKNDTGIDGKKSLLDDDWDLFEDETQMYG